MNRHCNTAWGKSKPSCISECSFEFRLQGDPTSPETPTLWSPDAKSWLVWKDPDAGNDWGQEEKGTTEDEMVGWRHRLDGHGFGGTLGVGDGQGGLACCGSWGRKEADTTERLNWTDWLTICIIGCRYCKKGFPGGASGKELACQYVRHRRRGFDP